MENTEKKIPSVTFKARVKDESGSYEWKEITTDELFKGKNVVLFALPGAFTPVCSSSHLPDYEAKYDELAALGVDDVICLSVNDAFVMNKWAQDQNIEKVRMLPDGNAEFTKAMNMLVKKENLGFGDRSWRYSLYAEDGVIKKLFVEPGFSDNCEDDPLEVSDVNTMIAYLKGEAEA